jgi:uncharacterized iron-regulated membrane protein
VSQEYAVIPGGYWRWVLKVGLESTIALLAVGLAISGAMIWLERRPRTNLDVRLVPTTPILLVGILMSLAAAIHLLGLMGKH